MQGIVLARQRGLKADKKLAYAIYSSANHASNYRHLGRLSSGGRSRDDLVAAWRPAGADLITLSGWIGWEPLRDDAGS